MSAYYELSYATNKGKKKVVRIPNADTSIMPSVVITAAGYILSSSIFKKEDGDLTLLQKAVCVETERTPITLP